MDRTRCLLSLSLKLMKMTYGSLCRSDTEPFNLVLNTAVEYDYEYNGKIRFFFFFFWVSITKINK